MNPCTAGRCIGVDYGAARVGVAVSDPSRTIADPRPYFSAPTALNDIVELVQEVEATEVIVGLPLNMDGSWSDSTRAARDFANALRAMTPVRVTMLDERLSTVEAERNLREAGTRGRKQKRKIDSAAAAVVLQAYLNGQRQIDTHQL